MRFIIPLLVACLIPLQAFAGPIYVYIEKDGVKRFSTKPPSDGVEAQVFTARKSSFSWYRVIPQYGGKSYFKKNKNKFNDVIDKVATAVGVDNALIRAVIHAESGFNQYAVSPKGAQGLMQLMPATARDLGVRNAFSPIENIYGGSKYLKMLLGRYNGNVKNALAAYNAGMLNVERYRGIPPFQETQNYVKSVMQLHGHYSTHQNS